VITLISEFAGDKMMKTLKARRDDTFLDEIVETLRSMPKQRLRIVQDIVGALAEPGARERGEAIKKKTAAKSLLKTPFCGMWDGRADITNGRSYAGSLRLRLERRGDRN
jgi:hypothetical protein